MKTRSFALLLAGAFALGVAWFVCVELRRESPTSRAAPVEERARGPADKGPQLGKAPTPAPSETPDEPASERRERTAAGPTVGAVSPVHLRFEVVALENGRPIQGAHVLCGNKSLYTDASGRGEAELDPRYLRDGVVYGVAGASGSRTFALGRLEPGETREVRVALPTAYDLRWFARVVDGESTAPIAGAELEAFHFERAARLEARDEREPARLATGALGPRGKFDYLPSVARGTTDGDGRAQLVLPSFGDEVVHVSAAGYARAARRARANEAQAPQTVELLRAAHLVARVREANGEPARGVCVRLRARSADLGAEPSLELPDLEWAANVDGDGGCALELPPHVPLTVELVRGERVLLRPRERQASDPGLMLAPGEVRTREWTLETGCALSGVALDGAERPLAGLELELRESAPGDGAEGWRELEYDERAPEPFAALTCDAEGSFALAGVPSGAWSLAVRAGDAELPRAAFAFRLSANEGERRLRLVLERGVTIRGTIFEPTGSPCAHALLVAESLECQFKKYVRSADDGSFQLGPLLTGRYRVSGKGDANCVVASAEARAGEAGLVLRLERGGTLRGRVTDEDGQRVAARVELVTANAGANLVQDETFAFERLPAGEYALLAHSDDGRVAVLRGLAVRPSLESAPLRLVLHRGCEVRLRLKGGGAARAYRVESDGVLLERGVLEPGVLTSVYAPLGPVAVSWWSVENGEERALEHEERRVLATVDEAAVFEYEVR